MTLVIAAVTMTAIYVVQRNMEADVRVNLERRFESEFAALLAVQEAQRASIVDRCRALVRSSRLHAALEDNGIDLLYSIAQGELRSVLPYRGSAPADRGVQKPQTPDTSLLRVKGYRFLDADGAVIPPPPEEGVEQTGPWDSQLGMMKLPEREQFGYVVEKFGADAEEIHEVMATPIVSTETGEIIAALILVFKPIEPPARLVKSGVKSGLWANGRLELRPASNSDTRSLALAVANAAPSPERSEGSFPVEFDGAPHLLHFKNLDPNSSLQPGILVSLYPLAESIAHQNLTRWEIMLAGAMLLLGGLAVSHFLAARLSVPVEKLEVVSTENAAQRDRAEAALGITNEELSVRNAELQKALTELKETQQHVIQQERLRALGQMASGIAHDFNNALVPILGFAELLQLSPAIFGEPKKARAYIDTIHTAAKDAASVVSRLRQFYRKQEADEAFTSVNLEKLVTQVITLTRPRWKDQVQANGATIEVESVLNPGPPISGDESALREVLTNLIFNAVDAMPSGGTITVRTRRTADSAALEVSDTGTGMNDDVRTRCLEPFFSTKGERGTGLGLSMVFGIVQRHGGTIDIRSELGKGTTFIITFPLHHAASEEAHSEDEDAPAQKPLRVLVVDDEPQVRDLLCATLASDGHQVEVANDGVAGLRSFRDGRFDLVLTDKAMPGMSGDQMACAIKQIAPRTPIILLTGFGQFLNKDELPGINALLSKPVGIRALREAFGTVMGTS